MLDSGTIHPSQTMWCKAVVLVRKKDGDLHFYIDFQCLNTCTKKNLHPLHRIQETLESLVGAGHFFMPGLEVQFLANEDGRVFETIHYIHCWQPRLLQVQLHAFWALHAPTMFQQLMKNCLGELNLIYCLIYIDDIVIFLHTAGEHLHCLHVVFDHFREHNLKLKPSKCNFFREEITYLEHWLSKDGMWPSNLNLKAIMECELPQTYTEACAFLGLVGHYTKFIKGFTCIAQPLNEHLTGEGARRKSEWVSLSGMPWRHLRHWNKCAWQLQFWLLLIIPSHFCWRQMHPKTGWGQYCPRSRQMDDTIQLPMQQSPHAPQEKLTFNKVWVFSTEVGCNGTCQGVPALSTFPGKDRQ